MNTELDELLRALANPIRRKILRLVWSRQRAAGDIANKIDLAQASVSEHLKVLRKSGLVDVQKDGNRWLYGARAEVIELFYELMQEQFPIQQGKQNEKQDRPLRRCRTKRT